MTGRHGEQGTTLVELVVVMLCCSIVMLAAGTVLLLGFRTQTAAMETARSRWTERTVLTMVEKLAGSGTIREVAGDGLSWTLRAEGEEGEAGAALLRYDSGKGTLSTNDTVLLEDVQNASAFLDGQLLHVKVQTEAGEYATAVYCRNGITGLNKAQGDAEKAAESLLDEVKEESKKELTDTEKKARYAMLAVLSAQFGSLGEIKTPAEDDTYHYFSEWYIGGYAADPRWSPSTPWCACFLSWAADKMRGSLRAAPRFADVDDGMAWFQNAVWGSREAPGDLGQEWHGRDEEGTYLPIPGDFVFFDWSGGRDPDHVGAVLMVKDNILYTIEGNSRGVAAVRTYALNDPAIVGYGVLPWVTGEAD